MLLMGSTNEWFHGPEARFGCGEMFRLHTFKMEKFLTLGLDIVQLGPALH